MTQPRTLARLLSLLLALGLLFGLAQAQPEGDPDAEAFRTAFPAEAGILQTITAECYYRDPRVLRALGLAPRPPFPLGHQVEDSDWSLLDPVKGMRPIWREEADAALGLYHQGVDRGSSPTAMLSRP